MDDKKAIEVIRNGNKEPFEDIVARYQKQAHFLAFRYLKDWDEADDITQTAFIRLYTFIVKSKEEIRVFPWIKRVIINLCLDREKNKKWRLFFKDVLRGKESGSSGGIYTDPFDSIKDMRLSQEDRMLNEELGSRIDNLIGDLPDQQRRIFIMKHFEGLKIKEIAQDMDISQGQVKAQLFRAVRNLRKGLGEFYERQE